MKHLKLIGMVIIALVAIVLFTGCSQDPIRYEGEIRDVIEVEEIIGDKLEVENPGKDLEVTITEEIDD